MSKTTAVRYDNEKDFHKAKVGDLLLLDCGYGGETFKHEYCEILEIDEYMGLFNEEMIMFRVKYGNGSFHTSVPNPNPTGWAKNAR